MLESSFNESMCVWLIFPLFFCVGGGGRRDRVGFMAWLPLDSSSLSLKGEFVKVDTSISLLCFFPLYVLFDDAFLSNFVILLREKLYLIAYFGCLHVHFKLSDCQCIIVCCATLLYRCTWIY